MGWSAKLIRPGVWSKPFPHHFSLRDFLWTLIVKMIVHVLPPKTKCHFAKTESEAYTSMYYMDISKTRL